MYKVFQKVRGIKETLERVTDLPRRFIEKFEPIPEDLVERTVVILTTYPPTTPGNQPPPPWWERGVGRHLSGGVIRPKSQRFGGPSGNLGSWAISQVGGEVAQWQAETRVSYAPFLVSDEYQARVHANTGWKTVEDALAEIGIRGKDITGQTVAMFEQGMKRIMDEMAGIK